MKHHSSPVPLSLAGFVVGLMLAVASAATSSVEDLSSKSDRKVITARTETSKPFQFDGDLRDLPQAEPEVPFNRGMNNLGVWPGLGPTGTSEPDPDLAVGTDHVIQAIETGGNTLARVMNKTTGQVLSSFFLASLGGGSSFCGDNFVWHRSAPFVAYDRYADRYILGSIGSYRESTEWNGWFCLYVSQTNNPVTGGWYTYQFSTPGTKVPFNPIIGVRRNAYVLSTYELNTVNGDSAPGGHSNTFWAFDRKTMVAGGAVSSFRIPLSNFQFMRGAYRAGVFTHEGFRKEWNDTALLAYRVLDDEYHQSGTPNPAIDYLEMHYFDLDFVAGIGDHSTQKIPMPDVNTTECSDPGSCLLQPWGPSLVQHIDRMPHGKISRPLPNTEFLVGAFPVFLNGSAAIRWFEMKRVDRGSWAWTQAGYATSNENLTSPSISRDWRGNIAVVANKVGPHTFPSIVWRGHHFDDAPGVMSTSGKIAAGMDVHSTNFWSDTRSILDLNDECTIWSTGMYTPNAEWSTVVSRTQFDQCAKTIMGTGFENQLDAWSAVVGE